MLVFVAFPFEREFYTNNVRLDFFDLNYIVNGFSAYRYAHKKSSLSHTTRVLTYLNYKDKIISSLRQRYCRVSSHQLHYTIHFESSKYYYSFVEIY